MIRPSYSGQQPEQMLSDPNPDLYREVRRKPDSGDGRSSALLHPRGRRHRRVPKWRLVSFRGRRERHKEADRECRARRSSLQVEGAKVLIARCNSATRTAVLSWNRELPRWVARGLPSAFLGKAGAECEPPLIRGSRLAGVVATGQITGGSHAAGRTGAPRRAGGQEHLSEPDFTGDQGGR